MAEQTTETEHEETTEHPIEEPEKGTEGDQDSAEQADATTVPDTEGDQEDVDWQSKADLYKAQMRKQEKRAKDNHAENERLKAELAKLQEAPEAKEHNEKTTAKEDQPDPVLARMDEITAKLTSLEAESATLKAKAAAAEHSQMIAEVAAAKGLTVDQARRLQGDTREELDADADEVIALFGLNQTNKRNPGPAPKPKEKKPLRGGSSNPDTIGDGRSREDILAAVTDTGRGRIKK